MSPVSLESASAANRITTVPATTIARSTTAARTRRLSSLGPVIGAADACAVAFIRNSIGTGVPEINAAVHHPPCGAGCGDRHGLQLLAPRGVRIRARNGLVEPCRRDPRGG